ncbi:hypothetical protein GLA29479_4134 [Lysobacter antibioticus]|nr:hypothetical protein GLA29479_4134 [Lysobacter antibioticus]
MAARRQRPAGAMPDDALFSRAIPRPARYEWPPLHVCFEIKVRRRRGAWRRGRALSVAADCATRADGGLAFLCGSPAAAAIRIALRCRFGFNIPERSGRVHRDR